MKLRENNNNLDVNLGQPSAFNRSRLDGTLGRSLRSLATVFMLGVGLDIDVKAGIPAPGVPYEVYEELGRKSLGPYRIGPDGRIEGGSVSVQSKAVNTDTGQLITVRGTGLILNEHVICTAAHCTVPRASNIMVTETKISWSDVLKDDDPSALTGRAIALNGWGNGPNRGDDKDMAVIILNRPIDLPIKPKIAKNRPPEGTVLEYGGFGARSDGSFSGIPMRGNGTMTGPGYPAFGLPAESFFAIQADPTLPDRDRSAWPIMAPSYGDSGSSVKIKATGEILGFLVKSDFCMPGDSVACDLTTPVAQSFLAQFTPNEPADVTIECFGDQPCVSWIGPNPKNVAVEASQNLNQWTTILPSSPAVIDTATQRWSLKVPSLSGNQTFYRLRWQP